MVTAQRPRGFPDPRIEMAHGAGGKASRRLIEGLFAPLFGHETPLPLNDAAVLEIDGFRLALTVDSFVVRPLRFPGGSIGELAVNGTVNDLAVSAARALALVVTFVIEAGTASEVVEAEARAMAAAAARAGVRVVGGDTKVVEHGKADGLYVTTAGVGRVDPRVRLDAGSVKPGDRILLSGPVGDHGITVLLARGAIELDANVCSDTRAVSPIVEALVDAAAPGLRWMRDPTRGGVATSLNELARDGRIGISIREDAVPVREQVRGACELLGLDPLHIANEGQFLAVIAPDLADAALEAVRRVPGGEMAVLIGEIRDGPAGLVVAVAPYGTTRVVDMLVGDPLPRIC
jgi:hydrogenase expression/formation protein HypE